MITFDPEEHQVLLSSMQIALLKTQPLASLHCTVLDTKAIPLWQALLFTPLLAVQNSQATPDWDAQPHNQSTTWRAALQMVLGEFLQVETCLTPFF